MPQMLLLRDPQDARQRSASREELWKAPMWSATAAFHAAKQAVGAHTSELYRSVSTKTTAAKLRTEILWCERQIEVAKAEFGKATFSDYRAGNVEDAEACPCDDIFAPLQTLTW